jgi:hypothetical protein
MSSVVKRLLKTASQAAPLHFSVFDQQLRSEVEKGIVPHLTDTFGLGFFHGGDASSCLEGISVEVFVVGISELPRDNWHAVIETCQAKNQACGIIVRTHDPAKWRRIAELQKKIPFAFVVAVGGPRTSFKQMFGQTPILCDVTDLEVPGQLIAEFIERRIEFERNRRRTSA